MVLPNFRKPAVQDPLCVISVVRAYRYQRPGDLLSSHANCSKSWRKELERVFHFLLLVTKSVSSAVEYCKASVSSHGKLSPVERDI
jgi:hypothetical protein